MIYRFYLDIAGRDSVLAAQVASPGSQVTIQFIALALEQAEDHARASEQSLDEYLENRTIADIIEQFKQDENCAWLMNNDFFMGNNGNFATVREVSEASHDIMMGASDVSMVDADSPREEGAQGQAATLDDTAATAQSGGSLETAGLSSSGPFLERRHHPASLPLRTSSRMSTTEHLTKSGQLSRTFPSRFSSMRSPSSPIVSTLPRCTATACGQTTNMPGRHVTVQVRGFISRSTLLSLVQRIRTPSTTLGLLFQAFCHTLMTTSWVTMTRLWKVFHWSMDDNRHTESKWPELTEGDVPRLLLFADRDVINRVRTQAAGSAEQATGQDTRGMRAFAQTDQARSARSQEG